MDQGFLSCHPGAFTDPKALNIAGYKLRNATLLMLMLISGRTSYITAFGSTSREAGVVNVNFWTILLIINITVTQLKITIVGALQHVFFYCVFFGCALSVLSVNHPGAGDNNTTNNDDSSLVLQITTTTTMTTRVLLIFND